VLATGGRDERDTRGFLLAGEKYIDSRWTLASVIRIRSTIQNGKYEIRARTTTNTAVPDIMFGIHRHNVTVYRVRVRKLPGAI